MGGLSIILSILAVGLKVILIVGAILVVLICLILFVPIRYRADCSYLEKVPGGKAVARWLFGFLTLRIIYDEDQVPRGEIRLLGIKIYDIFKDNAKVS